MTLSHRQAFFRCFNHYLDYSRFFFALQCTESGHSIPDENFWFNSFCQEGQNFLKFQRRHLTLRFYWFQLDQSRMNYLRFAVSIALPNLLVTRSSTRHSEQPDQYTSQWLSSTFGAYCHAPPVAHHRLVILKDKATEPAASEAAGIRPFQKII